VIGGSAVNHDGRSSSFTAPNGAAQAAAIRDALADAGLSARDIDYVEAHGTGTSLGDPIELDALAEVFADREQPLLVGSVKAAIGHTEAAAGVTSIIKAVLCLGSGALPPQANFSRRNPYARSDAPIAVADAGSRLPDGHRRVGVSAFGASGTNAHVVLEAADLEVPERGDGPPRLLLSAATAPALERLRRRIIAHLAAGDVAFVDTCYTAYVGRARLAYWLLAESAAELATAPIMTGSAPELAIPRGRRITLPLTPFERQRHWLEDVAPAVVARGPLLGEAHRSARSGEEVREGRLDAGLPWLRDHLIDGMPLLPAAAFLAMTADCGICALADVEYKRPLAVLDAGTAIQLVRDRDGDIALYADGTEGWSEIAGARAAAECPPKPFTERPGPQAELIDGERFAAELAGCGFAFGLAYRLVRGVRRDRTIAEAEIDAPPALDGWTDPALLDAALQTLTAILPPGDTPWLPARIARSVVGPAAPGPGRLACRARLRMIGEDRAVGDAILERAGGAVVAHLHGIELRPVAADPGPWFHDVAWRPAAMPAERPIGRWHAIGPGTASFGVSSFDETGEAPLPAAIDGIIDLRPLAATTPESCISATAALVRRAAALTHPPQLILVSRGASAAPPVLAGAPPAAAVLMGLQPVIAAEHPELRCRWLDLDPDDSAVPLAVAGKPGRYALRQGRLLAPEIVKAMQQPQGAVKLAPGPEHSFADLAMLPDIEAPPRPGEVRLQVAAAGLNFKDAMAVLGRAPDPEPGLGLECAGEVIAVGAGVDAFALGDPVFAFAPGALASRVNVPAATVLRRPYWLDEDTAASLPVAALTAWHGLCDIAAIGPETRVLVHAGAGGVGAMAVGLARALGARVFATASAGKAHAALAAGAEAVGDSRSLAFVERARRWAAPDGFDVVLNALGPQIADASAALLRPGGVFLEIGNASAPIAPTPIHHVAYDLTKPLAADAGWFAESMRRILALIESGRLRSPRRTVVPLARAGEALRALAEGSTIGKLVVRFPQPPKLRADSTYLVTGGTGAVGGALARWLADAGAGEVVLAARRAPADPDFTTVAVDVADRAAMAELLQSLPRLKGVIHAAGIVRDRALASLSEADIADATAAKIAGGANLDALTRDRRLDFFVLISSTAGSLAAPGQAAYAAANAWLDRLAAARRAAELPATAIGFGPWQGGMFARLDATSRRRIEDAGLRPMAPRRAVAAFARVLADGAVHRLVMDRVPSERAETPAEHGTHAALLAAPPGERLALLRDELARRLLALLGLPTGTRLDPQRALRDLGLDSLLSVSLRNELAAAFGLDLATTLVFDYPTVEALAAFLLPRLVEPEAPLDTLGESELAELLERELGAAS
jgi:acyl transferase domain-containing protein